MPSEKSHSTESTIEELLEQFSNGSSRKRRGLIKALEDRADELSSMGSSALALFDPEGDDWAAGWILQVLKRHKSEDLLKLFSSDFDGGYKTHSLVGIDYGP